jgi:hypothetical protein
MSRLHRGEPAVLSHRSDGAVYSDSDREVSDSEESADRQPDQPVRAEAAGALAARFHLTQADAILDALQTAVYSKAVIATDPMDDLDTSAARKVGWNDMGRWNGCSGWI